MASWLQDGEYCFINSVQLAYANHNIALNLYGLKGEQKKTIQTQFASFYEKKNYLLNVKNIYICKKQVCWEIKSVEFFIENFNLMWKLPLI